MKYKKGNAFANAFAGLNYFFRHERNGRIQAVIGLLAIFLGWFFRISGMEWIVVLICTGSVLSLEMLNSAVEKLCDLIQADFHPQIKIIKDVAAAAVLWAAMISAGIGIIIFLPKILSYI